MSSSLHTLLVGLMILMTNSVSAEQSGLMQLQQQVADTERTFAASMADRDFDAFTELLADEAVFFSGETTLRGKHQVAEVWKAYFDGPAAPFSWEPQRVEVLDSGKLALSTGPVRDAEGNLVATFTSIWRLEAPGQWRIIFDKGNRACDDPPPAGQDSSGS